MRMSELQVTKETQVYQIFRYRGELPISVMAANDLVFNSTSVYKAVYS